MAESPVRLKSQGKDEEFDKRRRQEDLDTEGNQEEVDMKEGLTVLNESQELSRDEEQGGSNLEPEKELDLSKSAITIDLNEAIGLQEWPDGSQYRGDVSVDLKLGHGVFTWVNGESYTGEFYKDHQHGKGVYTWPDGSKFTGYFYLSRKEGYGTMELQEHKIYQGLYKSDVRYGPGIETQTDSYQDVGIWLGHHLIRLCTIVPGSLSVTCYPELLQQCKEASYENDCPTPGESVEKQEEDPMLHRYRLLLLEDNYTLPEKIYSYSTNTDHLPLTASEHKDFDLHFYRDPEKVPAPTSHRTEIMNDMGEIRMHILKHRNNPEYLAWEISSIMNGNREKFGPCGPRERVAEQLIQMSGEGDYDGVSRILRHDLAHVDVADFHGYTALHAAAVSGHNKMINLLLDKGADVNKCNDEGLSALSLCMLLSYSAKSFRANVAERNLSAGEEFRNENFPVGSNKGMDPQQICTHHENSTCLPDATNKASPSLESQELSPASCSYSMEGRRDTIRLLLLRGADPNRCRVPMHALFFAIKAADVSTVQLLLERGAQTDIRLVTKHGTITPLHLAAALPGAEGVRITELLLHAAADPNAKAGDRDYIYEYDRGELPNSVIGFPMKGFAESGMALHYYFKNTSVIPEEGGRTSLHVACERDDNYKEARDIIYLLVSHNANPNILWSGHSTLSLAVASGNEQAVKELLANGADPNLPLSRGVGSALCAAVNTDYENGRTALAQIAMVDRLIKAGANMLMPITIGGGRKTAVGTATDYAYYKYFQDKRIAHTPYHALSSEDRDTFNARKKLLEHLGNLTREAVTQKEKEWADEEKCCLGSPRDTEATKSHNKEGEESNLQLPRKAFFKYCYQCGRSVGVKLSLCSRCHSIYTCSKQCKRKSWEELHKEECLEFSGKLCSKLSGAKAKHIGQKPSAIMGRSNQQEPSGKMQDPSSFSQRVLSNRRPGMHTEEHYLGGRSLRMQTDMDNKQEASGRSHRIHPSGESFLCSENYSFN
ncbi:ankyrin repeat and MYND domain-containing protein 1 [Xenopus tropicalis]|uniref:Ankyrin repeat and MYND domain-containing protein 1 n=1 Tax=Xenopus tropicalis TaxID=8364 RepID=A0JPA4_XENTR|eukprot:NP_001090676.1 ankyrin repeat and MYND domain-containing protein 1 [Xenopus tropicalis]